VSHIAAVKYAAVSSEGDWTERYNLENKVLISVVISFCNKRRERKEKLKKPF